MPKVRRGVGSALMGSQSQPLCRPLTMSYLSASLSLSQHLPREEKSARARPAGVQDLGAPRCRGGPSKPPSCPCPRLSSPRGPSELQAR